MAGHPQPKANPKPKQKLKPKLRLKLNARLKTVMMVWSALTTTGMKKAARA